MKECLLYTPVQLTPSTDAGLDRHGTATFASNLLPDTKDEFYQFCYINEKNKCLGSSLPFQLNCSLTDADLLSNGKSDKGDRFITLPDQDEADLLIVSTQRILTEEKLRAENRQLLDLKRRLESEREELRAENRSLLDIKQRLELEEEQLRLKLEAFQMNGQRTADTEQEYQVSWFLPTFSFCLLLINLVTTTLSFSIDTSSMIHSRLYLPNIEVFLMN